MQNERPVLRYKGGNLRRRLGRLIGRGEVFRNAPAPRIDRLPRSPGIGVGQAISARNIHQDKGSKTDLEPPALQILDCSGHRQIVRRPAKGRVAVNGRNHVRLGAAQAAAPPFVRHLAQGAMGDTRHERAGTRAQIVAVPGHVEIDQRAGRKLVLQAVQRRGPVARRPADAPCPLGVRVSNSPLRAVVHTIAILGLDDFRADGRNVLEYLVGRVAPLGRGRDHGHGPDRASKCGLVRIEAFLDPALRHKLPD